MIVLIWGTGKHQGRYPRCQFEELGSAKRRICQSLTYGLLSKEAEGVWLSSVCEALGIKGSWDIQMETFSR